MQDGRVLIVRSEFHHHYHHPNQNFIYPMIMSLSHHQVMVVHTNVPVVVNVVVVNAYVKHTGMDLHVTNVHVSMDVVDADVVQMEHVLVWLVFMVKHVKYVLVQMIVMGMVFAKKVQWSETCVPVVVRKVLRVRRVRTTLRHFQLNL
jgi:hypothetical protein